MTVLMSAYLIRSRVVPRSNGFRLYNYYGCRDESLFYTIPVVYNSSPTAKIDQKEDYYETL